MEEYDPTVQKSSLIGNFATKNYTKMNNYSSLDFAYRPLVFPLATANTVGLLANAALMGYIFWRRLYHNFISSHFIIHLCMTNMLGLGLLVPLFLINVWSGANIWSTNNFMCRIQVNSA
jgi:hypothetical protein